MTDTESSPSAQPGDDVEKKVALSLKLSESDYERLAIHGIRTRQKHQQIMHQAILKYLNDVGA
tara:strand:+ start:3722 stop:3910 length:189 start_codon:yes stop_codon:yes gene_type:complete